MTNGQGYLFRLTKFALGEGYSGSILLLAAQDDFVQNVRKLQFKGLVLAIIVGAAFIPVVWMFGSRCRDSLKRITAQARQLQNARRARSRAGDFPYQRRFTNWATPSISRSGRYGRSRISFPRRSSAGSSTIPSPPRSAASNRRSRWSSPMSRALRRLRSLPIPTC